MFGKRIPTILAIILLLAIGVGVAVWQKSKTEKVASEIIPESIKITNVADNKFSVSWTTKGAVTGSVEYGRVGEKLEARAFDDRGESHTGHTHHITVSGLQPGTNYGFRVISSESEARFDNNGSVYSVTTGPTISTVPAARSLYGEVSGGSADAILYVTLPNSAPASVTLTPSSSYSLAISTIRSSDLAGYVTYDPAASIISLVVDSGVKSSKVTVSSANMAPVPTIALGTDSDFRSSEKAVQIAQVEPTLEEPSPEPEQGIVEPQEVGIFNVEPIEGAGINAITNAKFSLTNPSTEGEVLSTTRPEFSGTGEANTTLTIAISGQKSVSDSVIVPAAGSWKWTPAIALPLGKQKITVSYIDNNDKEQKIERGFSITTASATSVPAFEATSSASTNASNSASPSPRNSMPSTESGVPTTGVMTPTLLTGALAFAIMFIGAFLLVL